MPSASPDKDLSEDLVPLLVKELKVAQGKIGQLELDLDQASRTANDSKQLAEAAEQAMEVLRQNFERVSEENCRLRLRIRMEIKEDSVKVKLEDGEVDETVGLGGDPSTNTTHDPAKDRGAYYSKYKDEKSRRKQSERTCRALQRELEEIRSANEGLQAQLDAPPMDVDEPKSQVEPPSDISWQPTKVLDLLDHLTYLPTCPGKPNIVDLAPICHDGVDLEEYLRADPRSSQYANNVLYLPGLHIPRQHHFLAVSPLYTYDVSKETWHKNERYAGIIGRTMSFFIRRKDLIYYAGEYFVKDLYAECPGRVASIAGCTTINWDKLADATMDPDAGEKKTGMNRGIIKRLYSASILTVVPLGLQCVGFNQSLYDQLKVRFEVSLPKSKRKELLELEAEKQSRKRRRVEGTSN